MGILDTASWAWDAQNILATSYKLDPTLPAMMFIRHSHRGEPKDISKIREIPLTQKGRDAAVEFGQQLSPDREYYIYYSPLFRCQDTAECIFKGIQSAGNRGYLRNAIYTLLKVQHRQQEIDKYLIRDKAGYIHKWIAGFYPLSKVESAFRYSSRLGHIVQNEMRSARSDACYIFVGHDVNHLAFRFMTTGIPVDDRWLDFMGGFFLQEKNESFLVYHRDQQYQVHLPYWWKRILAEPPN